jgi:demethylmenaquinone methyltransferase/2-methoxy-6-polyprenyl-1,4-benzoquinol methylase
MEPLLQGEEKVRAVRAMFDTIAGRYELVNRLMTFGLDRRWRRLAASALSLPAGSAVLDAGCGTGDLCRALASCGYRSVGIDISRGMLSSARCEAALVEGDILEMPFGDESFDGAASAFVLRNVSSLPLMFSELARVVRGGGRVALLEVSEPPSPLLRYGYHLWFNRVVPLIGAVFSDRKAYRYLPRSVVYLPEAGVIERWLAEAGFEAVRRRLLSAGAVQLWTATRGTRRR